MKKLYLILIAALLCGSLHGQGKADVYTYRGGGQLESLNRRTNQWVAKHRNDTLHGTSLIRSKGNFFLWHDGTKGTYLPCKTPCRVSAAKLTCIIEDYALEDLSKAPVEITDILPLLRNARSVSGYDVSLETLADESGVRLRNRSAKSLYANVLRINRDDTCTPLFLRITAAGERNYYLVKMPNRSLSEVPASMMLQAPSGNEQLLLLVSPDAQEIAPAEDLLAKILKSHELPENAGIYLLRR